MESSKSQQIKCIMCHIVQQEEVGQNCTQHFKNWLVMCNKERPWHNYHE
jgi:hypothetical protein